MKEWLVKKNAIIYTLLFVLLIITYAVNIHANFTDQHFVELARSFLNGQLDLPSSALDRGDVSVWNGKVYWPLAPFPSIALIPVVVLFGEAAKTGLAAFPLILFTAASILFIARRVGFHTRDSLWLIFGFILATPYANVLLSPISWQFAHVVAVALLFGALLEFYGKRRFWLIGVLYGALVLTRTPAALTGLFFLCSALIESGQVKKKITHALELAIPVLMGVAVYMLYNYFRFGDPMNVGYALANLGSDLTVLRDIGLMHPYHLQKNLYYMFIAPPLIAPVYPYIHASMWGIGFLFAVPYLLSLFWKYHRDKINGALLLGVIFSAIPILMFFSTGPFQLSYRYALDFFPLLFLVFMRSIFFRDKQLKGSYKIVFVLLAALNLYMYFNAVDIHRLLNSMSL